MTKTDRELIDVICEAEGVDEGELLHQATFDSVAPSICVVCEMVTEMEPDQDRGWCEECKRNTVKSCLILAGII